MGYFDTWKKMMGAENSNEAIANNGKELIIREFKNDKSYRRATLCKLDLTKEEIDIRIKNIDRTVNEKKIIFLPDTKVDVGSYVKYEGKTFIVEEFEDNSLTPHAKTSLCNQVIKFDNNITVDAVVEGESYGVKIFQGNNDFVTGIDTKVNITVGDTETTRKIMRTNTRVMFGNSEYGIYKIGDLTLYNEGLIICTCKKDKYMEGLDNLEEGICWQEVSFEDEEEGIQYTIEGSDTIRVGVTQRYTINPNSDTANFIVPMDLVTDNIIKYVMVNPFTVDITAIKPNELIELRCTVNGTEIIKDILTVR